MRFICDINSMDDRALNAYFILRNKSRSSLGIINSYAILYYSLAYIIIGKTSFIVNDGYKQRIHTIRSPSSRRIIARKIFDN